MPYRHVLAVCDGSAGAEAAVRAASALARRDGAQLTLAAVVELERPGHGCQFGASTWNDVLRDAAWTELTRARAVVDSPAQLRILAGAPGRALADGALEVGADAIMLPARSTSRLKRMLSRDPAPALRRRVNCVVLHPA
jgi:nucleotide-binding universal stress UspA family protein